MNKLLHELEICTILFTMNRFMGKLFPLLPFFTTNKDEIHEERLIVDEGFSIT